jgi:hypothetical protein
VTGGSHSRDPTGMLEEMVDDYDSLGKTTAITWVLAMREESPNGRVELQLAGGGLPWHGEKLRKAEEASAGWALLYPGGEREVRGPAHRRLDAGVEPSTRAGFPCSQAADGWASVGVSKVARV